MLLIRAFQPGLLEAQVTSPELRRARQQLMHYDLQGHTFQTLADLTRFISNAHDADRREARFLRAVAATDLILLSLGQSQVDVRQALARAVRVRESQLLEWLDGELGVLHEGVYAEQVEDCRWVVSALEGGNISATHLHGGEGLRRDVLFVHAVVDALDDPRNLAALAGFGREPCNDGLDDCALGMFTQEGRLAVSALTEADRALTRLEQIAASGEPLTSSLAAIVLVDAVVLRTSEIQPTPRLSETFGVQTIASEGFEAQPDVLLFVHENTVRWGHVARIRVANGEVVRSAGQGPVLPQTAELPAPQDHRVGVTPFPALVTALRSIDEREQWELVGMAASAPVDARRMARVLVSMRDADMHPPILIARGEAGEIRGREIRLATEDSARASVAVFVRLGGYSVHRSGAPLSTIPRVRRDGHWQFNHARLAAITRRRARPPRTVSLRFMSVVPWTVVLDAAFALTSRRPLAVILN